MRHLMAAVYGCGYGTAGAEEAGGLLCLLVLQLFAHLGRETCGAPRACRWCTGGCHLRPEAKA